jgi:hypothetical protein
VHFFPMNRMAVLLQKDLHQVSLLSFDKVTVSCSATCREHSSWHNMESMYQKVLQLPRLKVSYKLPQK